MKKSPFTILAFIALMLTSGGAIGQEDSGPSLDLGSDIVSRYVWRGTDFGNSPSIQPYISFDVAGFEVGTWGSYSINGANMQEVDLYASYTFLKDAISVGVTDYFFPDHTAISNHYYDYKESSTNHIFEANLNFNGLEKLPITLSVNYNFYGADADNSWYLELGYNGTCKVVDYNFFVGATPGQGIYLTPGSDGFSFVNVGLGVSKEIRITDSYSLPIFGQLITNPQAQNIFLVFGISL